MKEFRRWAVAGAALGLLLVAPPALRAEDGAPAGETQGKHWDKFDRLKKLLDLTDDQVSQWEEAEKGQHEAVKLLRDKAQAAKAQLAVLVDEKASDDKLSSALDEFEVAQKAVVAQSEKQQAAIKAILNPLQQAKLALFAGGHHRGPGGHGGFGAGWKPAGPGEGGQDKP
jgi:Spy/CpxP family protein refolding chaperone